ncbi:hypothetical protein YC2023_031244 [Brassica napus]
MSFSVKVSWAPQSRVLLLKPSRTVLMPLRLCLRHCASNYSACVSSFVSGSISPPLPHTDYRCFGNPVIRERRLDLLAKRLGKKRIIAETGAGQHGVATATVCAQYGLECIISMGAQDMERQALNVFRMRLLGAEVRGVHSGTATLKDVTSEAIRDWVTNVETTHYILGSVAGPHPYPMMVETFTRGQDDWCGGCRVRIGQWQTRCPVDKGRCWCSTWRAMSYLLQDDDGQIIEPQLDYPGVGPEHSFFKDMGWTEYYSVTDEEALEAFNRVSRLEGIISALETSHALAHLEKLCPTLPDGARVVLNFSGRGDKDDQTVAKYVEV